ncbi:MAG: hypothetical protein PVH61_14640 [Candidatus Aminicenantes bacterium]
MSFIDEFIEKIVFIITELAREKLGGGLNEAQKDTREFLDRTKTDIIRWFELLQSDVLTKEEFIRLVKSKKDLLEMTALKQTGLSLVEVEEFRDNILYSLIKVAYGLLTGSIGAAAEEKTMITEAFIVDEFSLKDKLLISAGILGGYSFLPEDEYVIPYMMYNTNAEVIWEKYNVMLAEIANAGANAVREFPWWCLSISHAKQLVPFAFDETVNKFDLSQLDNNNYFHNLGKIARLANLYGLTFIYDIYNGSEARVKDVKDFSPWNGKNNIQGLSDYFYGPEASEYRGKLELRVIETLKHTDFMLELCNEPSVKAAEALAETYIRLIKNGVPASRILIGWDYKRKKQKEKGKYAAAYRKWRDLVTAGLGQEWPDTIKQESWSPIHKMTFDTLNDYWLIGLEPDQQVPSNALRNTIYDMDGVRNPRPTIFDAQNMTLKIITVKRKAVENGRVGIGVVYGKETGFKPDDAIKGVANAYNEKFKKYPVNYGKFPEPLPLPQWIYDEPEPPVIALPQDLVQALNCLKPPVVQLIQSKQAIENQWAAVLPVLQKYNLV